MPGDGIDKEGGWQPLPDLPVPVEGCAMCAIPHQPAGSDGPWLVLVGGETDDDDSVAADTPPAGVASQCHMLALRALTGTAGQTTGGLLSTRNSVGDWIAVGPPLAHPRAFATVFVAAAALWVVGGRDVVRGGDCAVVESVSLTAFTQLGGRAGGGGGGAGDSESGSGARWAAKALVTHGDVKLGALGGAAVVSRVA